MRVCLPLKHSSDVGQDPQVGRGTLPSVTSPAAAQPRRDSLSQAWVLPALWDRFPAEGSLPFLPPSLPLDIPCPRSPVISLGGQLPATAAWDCRVQSKLPRWGHPSAGACCCRTRHVGLSGLGWQQTGKWRGPAPPGTAWPSTTHVWPGLSRNVPSAWVSSAAGLLFCGQIPAQRSPERPHRQLVRGSNRQP